MKLAAISVDLDEIDCYAAIHGLERKALPESALHAVYERALPRLTAMFARLDVPVTWFAIGRDLGRSENATRLRDLQREGHEIANHSLNHCYDLTRRSRAEQAAEVRAGADAIEAAVGTRPVGFRAPGYTITNELAAVLTSLGVQYDASVFPCPAYYSAKAAAMAAIRARGRRSKSVLDHPRVLLAPAEPYRMAADYTKRGAGILEIPNGVTSDWTGRLPFIGTSLTLAGTRGARWLSRAIASRDFVSLELHGIDLSDAAEDGLGALVPFQPDLKKSAHEKEAALTAAIETLRERGFTFITLAAAAARF